MWHHKDVIIIVLTLLLVVVSGIAICLGINSEEGEHGRFGDRMGRDYYDRQDNYVDDNNKNPNDGEYADENASSTSTSTSALRGMVNEIKEKIK